MRKRMTQRSQRPQRWARGSAAGPVLGMWTGPTGRTAGRAGRGRWPGHGRGSRRAAGPRPATVTRDSESGQDHSRLGAGWTPVG